MSHLNMDHNNDLDPLKIFGDRLKRLGIDVEFTGNYPWIYVDYINGKRVTEKFEGDHGFTVAFLPVRADRPFHFTDIKEIFKLIRKYV